MIKKYLHIKPGLRNRLLNRAELLHLPTPVRNLIREVNHNIGSLTQYFDGKHQNGEYANLFYSLNICRLCNFAKINNIRVKNILVGFLALFVLFSTIGFNIYKHTCTTQNINNRSILIPVEKCGHTNHEIEKKLCCKTDHMNETCSADSNNNSNKDDCCSDHHQFKKLETNTIIVNKGDVVKAINTLIIEMLYAKTFFERYNNNQYAAYTINESPPNLITSASLSLIQIYLI